ncbi:ABC transporter ATP-binding protein [Gorillibacterium timonense]|uniref:ABC transporter ATP-binding protein n=1 Tax=Gorillibacterium timonense TaxID=1689269 RepID=UPI00071DBF18|nr:ABC transporter ATP-binding protein [Gorillibacterium timonense]
MAVKESASPTPAPAAGTLTRMLGLSRPYLGSYLILCIFTACVSASAVVLAESLRRIVNAATNHSTAELGGALILGVGSILLDVGGNYVKTYLAARLEYTSTAKLQAAVLRKVLRIRTKEFEGYHSADLISRINDSAAEAQKGLNVKAVDLLGNLLQIVFVLTYLITMEWSLTVGTLLISVLTPLVMLPFTKKLRGLYADRQKAAADQQAFVQDTVQGAELVKSFGLFARMQESFRNKYDAYMVFQAHVLRIEAVGYQLPFVVIIGGLLYVLGFGGYLVIHGKLDVGALAAFLVSFEQFANPLSKISNLWTELQGALGQASRMFEVLDLEEEDSTSGTVAGKASGEVAFPPTGEESRDLVLEQVSYRYAEDRLVLNGVSLVIEAGKTTAFAGPSGGGKSTLMKLLLRAYEPEDGSIRYGDNPLNAIPAKAWREGLAYVSQEPYLFSGTLYDNIAWGRPGASREEVEEAARLAAIHEFIMRTPEQYSTRIGERGLTLSGGERQRISIARAFIRDPKLLLLDEPTSALDSGSEEIVQAALARLMRGRTTVVIAHRLSTIRDADRIYYLEGGSVLESGTHDELIRLNGRYCSMYERGRENGKDAEETEGGMAE